MLNYAVVAIEELLYGSLDTTVSPPVAVSGNKVVATTTIENISGANGITVAIEGSYDGRRWETLVTSSALTSFGVSEIEKASLDWVLVRVKAVSGSLVTALFRTELTFSSM